MNFGALPPEINSARMYSGAGAAPMLGAASAWNELAAELHTTAECYHSAVAAVTSVAWTGPASMRMASAAARYVTWMSQTAALVERTAAQVEALAGAYQVAFAGTVPPAQIAANRSLLAALVATNILGQNSPAIAATEAQYAEMWAQDAAVMYGYADSSSVASMLTPFDAPPQTTDPTGAVRQGAAAASAQQSLSSGLASTVQQTLQNLSSTPSSTETWQDLQSYLPQILKNFTSTEQIVQRLTSTPANIVGLAKSLMPAATAAASTATAAAQSASAGATGLAGAALSVGGPLAAVGRAGTLGGLSIPPSWASIAATANTGALSLPVHTVGADPGDGSGMLRGLPMSGAGQRRNQGFVTKYGVRHRVIPGHRLFG